MATFSCKTKGNADPKGKPRVYFCCHPEDFDRYFDKLREDIFKTHDCAIYYTADMTEAFDEHDMDTDLGQMNLFVVPVTFRLLSQPNRAMDVDLAYAKRQNIAILPFMMESGIDAFYSAPEKFGQRQYINPYSTDATEISYEDKLKKYLEAVLISDETAQRVRDAFDAYIFLSYRKKDRRYANQLMRLIHKNPEYRDIAIWYDEFLTPGESFKQNIDKAMQNSKLFTLLVTPNLLEYVNGEPNFVMGVEYPAAKSAGMGVLPAEMVKTDKAELREKYEDIPDCVTAQDEPALRERLLEALDKIAKSENNNDPEHNFLIGLAYLDGIDVEVDRDRALTLITSAAEADLPEAMEKLYRMYSDGSHVDLDYRKAIVWAKRVAKYYQALYGDEHASTLFALGNLAVTYGELGDHKKALELNEKVYALRCRILGEEHPDTLISLSNLAYTYGELGNHKKALEITEKVYALRCRILGEEHPDTLRSLHNLASTYGELGNHKKALELKEKVYALICRILGEEHPDTLQSLNNLAVTYYKLGDHKKALELQEKVYALRCRILGEEHPDTLQSLHNLAVTYGELGDHKKALELKDKVYALRCRILGEEHPDTLRSLNNLASTYGELGDHKKELELEEKVYALRCRILGEEHPYTLQSLSNLAVTYGELGDHKKELELEEKGYALICRILGEEHPDTLQSLHNLAYTYGELGNHKKALELKEKVYALRCRILGEEHPDTLTTLGSLAITHYYLGNYATAADLMEKVYVLRCKVLGEEHRHTIVSRNNLQVIKKQLQ